MTNRGDRRRTGEAGLTSERGSDKGPARSPNRHFTRGRTRREEGDECQSDQRPIDVRHVPRVRDQKQRTSKGIELKLYAMESALYSQRVLVYLAEKGVTDLDRVHVDLTTGEHRQPAFLAVNPAGTVPVLEVGPGGIIRQSTSILEYLEEKHPSPDMIGDTPEARAATRDLVYMINEGYIYLSIHQHHSRPYARVADQNADVANAAHYQYRRSMGRIEQVIGDGEFLRTDDRPTIADCMLFASAQFSHQLYREPLPRDCPKLGRWYARFEQRPSAAVPEYPERVRSHFALTR